jgi:hypothetical protein
MTEPEQSRTNRFAAAFDRLGWVVLVLAAGLCVFVTVSTIAAFVPTGRTFADWLTYVHAVERVMSGEPIYPPEQLSGPYVLPNVTLFGYAYPPSSVPMFLPFVSYPGGLVAWLTLNVGMLVTGLYAALRREFGHVRPLEFAFVLLGLASVRGFAEGVAFGNASVGLAGLLAWCWALGRGRTSIGVLSGLGGTIKLVPGTVVFWSTRETFPRVLLSALAVGGALFVLTLPVVGIESWFDYVRALSFSEPACGVDAPRSVACTLQPIVGIGPAKLAGIAFALVAGGLAVLARAPLLSFALVVVAWLAPVTDLHYHYLLVVYVLAVVVAVSWLGARRNRPNNASTTVARTGD